MTVDLADNLLCFNVRTGAIWQECDNGGRGARDRYFTGLKAYGKKACSLHRLALKILSVSGESLFALARTCSPYSFVTTAGHDGLAGRTDCHTEHFFYVDLDGTAAQT